MKFGDARLNVDGNCFKHHIPYIMRSKCCTQCCINSGTTAENTVFAWCQHRRVIGSIWDLR